MATSSVIIAAPNVVPMHHIKTVSRCNFDDPPTADTRPSWPAASEASPILIALCILHSSVYQLRETTLPLIYESSNQMFFRHDDAIASESHNGMFLLDLH